MHKIIDYMTVTTIGDNALTEAVREFLNAGWQPLGNPSIAIVSHADQSADSLGTAVYAQAMVKYEQ